MKAGFLMLILLVFLGSCNSGQKQKQSETVEKTAVETDRNIVSNSRGYELMQQKCYICHTERPDPSMRGQMIAPPMLNVKEHYKPSYPDKDEFIDAMVAFIRNPSKEKTLMPGAVQKFNLMPKLIYDDTELRLIAEAIYEHDFGSAPQMRMQNMQNLQLNRGEKWSLKKSSMDRMNAVIRKLDNFDSSETSEYNQLGKEVFDEVKLILMDDSYSDEIFDQLHNFFGSLEANLHALISARDINEAEKQLTVLKTKFKIFPNYFE